MVPLDQRMLTPWTPSRRPLRTSPGPVPLTCGAWDGWESVQMLNLWIFFLQKETYESVGLTIPLPPHVGEWDETILL
jgi:hypothetical protein